MMNPKSWKCFTLGVGGKEGNVASECNTWVGMEDFFFNRKQNNKNSFKFKTRFLTVCKEYHQYCK